MDHLNWKEKKKARNSRRTLEMESFNVLQNFLNKINILKFEDGRMCFPSNVLYVSQNNSLSNLTVVIQW